MSFVSFAEERSDCIVCKAFSTFPAHVQQRYKCIIYFVILILTVSSSPFTTHPSTPIHTAKHLFAGYVKFLAFRYIARGDIATRPPLAFTACLRRDDDDDGAVSLFYTHVRTFIRACFLHVSHTKKNYIIPIRFYQSFPI